MRHVFLIAILLAAPCGLQATTPEDGPSPAAQLTLDDLRTFTDVFNQLRTNFVFEVDDHTLLVAAIEGMVSRLDPYSAFLRITSYNVCYTKLLRIYRSLRLDCRPANKLKTSSVTTRALC